MKKRLLIALLSAVTAALALGAGAVADPDSNHGTSGLTSPLISALIGNDTLFATADLTVLMSSGGMNHTQHYGPYPSMSPDSGTCGNDWADDTFDRHFTVRSNGDATYTVVQQFKRGSFITNGIQPSPGSCDDGPFGTVDPGITGSMHGYFIISNVGMQTSTSPFCDAVSSNANCTTTKFINSHFTPCYPGVCQVTTFFFHFAAGDQGLAEHEWQNASEDRGGNRGDIRSAP